MKDAFHRKQQPLFGRGEAADRPRIGPYESKCLEDSEVSISLRVDLNTLPDIKLSRLSLGYGRQNTKCKSDCAQDGRQAPFRRISGHQRTADFAVHGGDFADHTHRLSS